MAEIAIPDELLHRVEQAVPESVSAETFVADAVRERLAWQERKAEFYRLSDETRRLLGERGISEAQILADFEAFRQNLTQ